MKSLDQIRKEAEKLLNNPPRPSSPPPMGGPARGTRAWRRALAASVMKGATFNPSRCRMSKNY